MWTQSMKSHFVEMPLQIPIPILFFILRGCLSKNHPLNLAQKIILPETLPTERLY